MNHAQAKVMPQEFNPTRRGRNPLVEIGPYLDQVMHAAPAWVCFELDDIKVAGSVMRQLNKVAGMEVATQLREPEGKNVYARWIPGQTRK